MSPLITGSNSLCFVLEDSSPDGTWFGPWVCSKDFVAFDSSSALSTTTTTLFFTGFSKLAVGSFIEGPTSLSIKKVDY